MIPHAINRDWPDEYSIGDIKVQIFYEDDGAHCILLRDNPKTSIEIQLPWKRHECFIYPSSCNSCPVGFSNRAYGLCGRNIPWTAIDSHQRPSTCILKLFDLIPFLNML